MSSELQKEDRVLGVYPCKIVVSLNVKANAKDTGELSLGVSESGSAATASAKRSGEAAAERGNTIQIEMYNAGCLPKDTLGYHKPDQIGVAAKGLGMDGKIKSTAEEDPSSPTPQTAQ